jgi:hypothetical protein
MGTENDLYQVRIENSEKVLFESLRGAQRRACALERFGAQAWQSLEFLRK